MSYNPAFEYDECALDGENKVTNNNSNKNGGIKLTSFKQIVQIDDIIPQTNKTLAHKHIKQNNSSESSVNFKQQQVHHDTSSQAINSLSPVSTQVNNLQEEDTHQKTTNSFSSSSKATSPSSTLSSTSSSSPAKTNSSASSTSSTSSSTSSTSTSTSTSTDINVRELQGSRAAVECRDLVYEVGRLKNKKTILSNINVTIPEGSIYGLLGPSGCGKTTMLKCVIGRVKPKSGQVRVFGYKPNEPGSQIPGAAVGYMPQEISVYDDFTINETLTYFGKINRMHSELIVARIDFLITFLDLPGKHRLVASLSGGQKRRVSLAAALVHSPPLLILDEPTVGVDPLLRQSIWKHLVTLAESEKITVLITTHYIEEARQANVVGLMRHGKLLAEDSPERLMAQHSLDSLEDVFLKLCIGDSSRRAARLAGVDVRASSDPPFVSKKDLQALGKHAALLDAHGSPIVRARGGRVKSQPQSKSVGQQLPAVFTVEGVAAKMGNEHNTGKSLSSPLALSSVKVVDLKHQHSKSMISSDDETITNGDNNIDGDSLTEFVVNKHNLPSMVPGSKYPRKKVSAGAWIKSLLAVTWKNYVRLKRNPPVLVFEFVLPAVQVILFCLCIGGDPFDVPLAVVNDELIPQASKYFLDALDKQTIRQVPYDNLSSAIESVRRGDTWGAIHIPDRYTHYLQERLTHPADITNETISNGTINIYPDLTNLHLALAMENTFREAFIKFAKDTLNMFGYDPASAELPIKIETPVYGTMRRNGYLEFMTPGVVISITYVMATGLTALAFILEKRDGLLERSLVSGVTTSQILLAHAAVQVVVMTMQIALVLTFTFFVFDIPSNGPFFWVVLLILLQGCTGMGFGLLVSALCEEENTAVMMLVGTFYTNLILAGIIWPIEAMPRWLRLLSYVQPQTLPTEALRNILSRGWGIAESGVYLGFMVTIGWLIVFLLAAGLAMRYSK